jgi:CheY-like chemotaxis protein
MTEGAGSAFGVVGPARRCLFGVTILLVEDSRAASEALRLFAVESGARLHRADSLAAAHRHLAIFRPNVIIVDLGLPDGNGVEFIAELAAAPTPFGAIVATSGNEPGTWEAAALDAGAAACLEKPLRSLASFQSCVLSLLPDRGAAPAAGAEIALAGNAAVRDALEADLRRALDLLERAVPEADAETVAYCAQFLATLGDRDADAAVAQAARAAEAAADPVQGGAAIVASLRRRLVEGVRGAA